jgi:hypothetical protein
VDPGNVRTVVTLIVASAASLVGGCASDQARQGTAEVYADVQAAAMAEVQAEVSAIRSAVVEIKTEVQAVKVTVCDESKRITDTTQNAVVAVSRVDNSTSDKWVNRGLLAMVGVLSYVVGKMLWIMVGGMIGRIGGQRDDDDNDRLPNQRPTDGIDIV